MHCCDKCGLWKGFRLRPRSRLPRGRARLLRALTRSIWGSTESHPTVKEVAVHRFSQGPGPYAFGWSRGLLTFAGPSRRVEHFQQNFCRKGTQRPRRQAFIFILCGLFDPSWQFVFGCGVSRAAPLWSIPASHGQSRPVTVITETNSVHAGAARSLPAPQGQPLTATLRKIKVIQSVSK